eukprot:CAMPEP_0185725862 /NCGR_PEP_ID=MMETSP1171-20130828/2004_1 /TAXON_ID=374046 /ORGANISM="Helicotheca tamensis, Strain CCMP826" /LENGTH=777 /DNA_ID=CAMNT_0028394083 /DNA_START=30 /DNA_END=2363 /DNA_ORIENTATION=-
MSDEPSSGAPPDFLLDRLAAQTSRDSSKVAMTFLGSGPDGGKVENSLTYAKLSEEIDRVAGQIADAGLAKGDRAVLVYPPSLDFVVAFLACLRVCVVAVPVFPPHPARRDTLHMFSRIVESCGAKYAFTSGKYSHMKKLGDIKENFTKFKRPANAAAWPEQLQWVVTDNNGGNKKKSGAELPSYAPSSSDVAFLQFTSGSTSEPKGVMITHGNLAHNLTIITNELQAVGDTIVVSWLPQYHDMGLIGSYLGLLYCGGSGYYLSPLTFLQRPMIWIEAVSKYRATHLQAPNFAFKLTSRKFDAAAYGGGDKKLDLSSVRHIINAAEPVTVDSVESFSDAFCPFGMNKHVIYPTYGLAEHTVFVCSGGKQQLTVSKKDLEVDGVVKEVDDANDKSDAEGGTTVLMGCGYPSNQKVDVRIVDAETMQEVDNGNVGEIWVRSASKAAGYYNKPDETTEDFHAKISKAADDDDGEEGDAEYLKTGDLGFMYKEELFICGRIKDLIIVGGRNYYPQDIEETAQEAVDALRPGCTAAFTVDPVDSKGEEVAFIAELRDVPKGKDAESTYKTLAEQIRSAINTEHSLGISYIALLKPRTIPKTTSGKIARAWCRKGFVNKTLDSVYTKSFKFNSQESDMEPLEIEQNRPNPRVAPKVDAETIRNMDRKDIMEMLINDVCTIGGISRESCDKDVPIVSLMSSISISEFKGKIEHEYSTKLSDEYLFRETTTLIKLTEVVKQGFAPDDTDGEGASAANVQHATPPGGGGGLAQKLGCPPGVVCCVVM